MESCKILKAKKKIALLLSDTFETSCGIVVSACELCFYQLMSRNVGCGNWHSHASVVELVYLPLYLAGCYVFFVSIK